MQSHPLKHKVEIFVSGHLLTTLPGPRLEPAREKTGNESTETENIHTPGNEFFPQQCAQLLRSTWQWTRATHPLCNTRFATEAEIPLMNRWNILWLQIGKIRPVAVKSRRAGNKRHFAQSCMWFPQRGSRILARWPWQWNQPLDPEKACLVRSNSVSCLKNVTGCECTL